MTSSLPFLLAGPILRKTTETEVVLWVVTSTPLNGNAELYNQGQEAPFYTSPLSEHESIQVGTHAWVSLIQLKGEFPTNTPLVHNKKRTAAYGLTSSCARAQ